MKKTLIYLLCLLLFLPLFTTTSSAMEHELSAKEFLSMNTKECLQALQARGVIFPDVYADDSELEIAVETVLNGISSGTVSEGRIPYNFTGLVELSKEILKVVPHNQSHNGNQGVYNRYVLQNSTVVGSWQNSFQNYNCYEYSLGRTANFVNPGYYSDQTFNISMTASQIADLAILDLDALGFWASKTTTKPSSLAPWEKVICVRKCSADYHFMRSVDSGNWLHKPGGTNPLKWNYSNPGYMVWTNEYSYRNQSYPGNLSYTSEIYYIKYWSKSGPGPQPDKLYVM